MKKFRLLVILSFICACLIALACCGKPTLATPKNFKVDETTLMLSWDSVKDAKGYKVYVNNEEYNTTKPRYPLDPLAPGEYNIVVKAVGISEETNDSELSKPYTYVRPTESGLSYALINNKTEYEIRGLGSAAGNIVIEDTYRGKPITQIGDMAFANKSKDVISVTLGKNIKSIGDRAFYNCSLLESIVIPDSVTEIGAYAFQGCRTLKTVDLPDDLTEISNYAFAYCRGLTSISIPEGVTKIGERAFMGCDVLESITIPDSVETMGIYAFSEALALKSVTIGDGLETLPEYTFLNCASLQTIDFGEGLKNIDQYAFSGCITLQSVVIPNNVEKIGLAAFINCLLLTSVDLSDNLTAVGASAFAGSLLWAAADGIVYVDGWILGRNSDELTEVVIPEGTVGIADRAFYQCDETWEASGGWALTIPDSVKYIGDYAFYKTEYLASLSLGEGMVRLGKSAFAYGKILRTVIIKEGEKDGVKTGLQVIDDYAFQACSRLKLEKLPSTLVRIGTYAFEATPNWTNSMSLVYVDNWLVGCVNPGLQNANLNEGTRGIADYAFYQTVALTKVVIPETVKYIGRCAFKGCTALQEAMLPLGLERIEEFTFYQCSSLTEMYIPQTVNFIGYSAFNKCISLTSVNIPAKVETIDEYAFYKCVLLSSLTFETTYTVPVTDENGEALKDDDGNPVMETVEAGVQTINNRAFYGCTALTEIVLPDSLTYMGTHVFYKCTGLTSLTVGEGLKEINKYSFYGCTALTEVNLSDGLEKIGDYAFRGCTALTSVEFGANLKEIGRYGFYGCTALETIELPASVTVLDDYAFRNCNALKSVILPATLTTLNKHVFNGCNNATFYVEHTERPQTWFGQWNSSYRPVVWGCTLSADKSYVVSFVKTETSINNPVAVNGMSAPTKEGFEFAGWTTVEGGTTAEYTMETMLEVENGTTLYTVWKPKAETNE